MEEPEIGSEIVIEKFERYAETCSYAIALFTPDDEVTSGGETYLQARPNVIYELGWFCGRLGRLGVMLLLQSGTSLFSDFGGIIRKTSRGMGSRGAIAARAPALYGEDRAGVAAGPRASGP